MDGRGFLNSLFLLSHLLYINQGLTAAATSFCVIYPISKSWGTISFTPVFLGIGLMDVEILWSRWMRKGKNPYSMALSEAGTLQPKLTVQANCQPIRSHHIWSPVCAHLPLALCLTFFSLSNPNFLFFREDKKVPQCSIVRNVEYCFPIEWERESQDGFALCRAEAEQLPCCSRIVKGKSAASPLSPKWKGVWIDEKRSSDLPLSEALTLYSSTFPFRCSNKVRT